jgi:hypothetical protein
LRGKAIDWLNYIKDIERVNIALWSMIEPHFKSHYDIQVQTVDNVWDFSKLKHDERDDSADLKLKVSKLINNVSSTAPDFIIEIKERFTFEEVQIITRNATQNLKTHLMKTLFINKLAPAYKDYVLSQEPETLNDATNTARAMWKRKHPVGQLPKIQNLTMSPITTAINGLPEDIREECILPIKTKGTILSAIIKATLNRITILVTKVQTTESPKIKTKVRNKRIKIQAILPTTKLRAGFGTKKVTHKSHVGQELDRINQ